MTSGDEGAADRDQSSESEEVAYSELHEAAELLDRLFSGVKTPALTDPVQRVNQRTPFISRYSSIQLGAHDGLARFPDGTGIVPSAVVSIDAEHEERSHAIELAQNEATVQAEALVTRYELAVKDAELRLEEATYRLAARHPDGSRAGFFGSTAEAVSATAEIRAEVIEREREAAEASNAADTSDGLAASSGTAIDPDPEREAEPEPAEPTPPTRVRATDEQRVAAAKELRWKLPLHWFWLGSVLLFGAEFPFIRAVVRQLLLERHPREWLVLLSTASITFGFLIATKLAGLLLRSAQSMFLLASLIHPTRRPAMVRAWIRIRKRERWSTSSQATNPTEEGLRFGAWARLIGAFLLIGIIFFAVLAFADYRSAAVTGFSKAAAVSSNGADRFTSTTATTTPPGSTTVTSASNDEAFDAVAGQIPSNKLRRVFLAISLLNVVGAIGLAWASSAVPFTEVFAEDIDGPPEDSASGVAGAGVSRATDPPQLDPSERVPSRTEQSAEDLEAEVLACRRDLAEAKVHLAGAVALRDQVGERTAILTGLSKTQAEFEQKMYWWANRAVRQIAVPPEVDQSLARTRGGRE